MSLVERGKTSSGHLLPRIQTDKASQLMSGLQQWLTQMSEPDGNQINIDDKMIRGSAHGEQKGVHMGMNMNTI